MSPASFPPPCGLTRTVSRGPSPLPGLPQAVARQTEAPVWDAASSGFGAQVPAPDAKVLADGLAPETVPARGRLALGISYRGTRYRGWQSQPDGQTVQDALEVALASFAATPVELVKTVCAGRTDAGVHAVNQVVHLDPPVQRDPYSWVRGTNRFLPADVALQWCQPVSADFHARYSALGRRYCFRILQSAVRPALEEGLCGWVFAPLEASAMQEAAAILLGEHDFSSFRSSLCQAKSPVKTLRRLDISRHGAYWRFDVEANAFLHHMVRNIVGCLVSIGQGRERPEWMAEVLAAKSRDAAAPTFPPQGLYFMGPVYDAGFAIPQQVPALDWLR